MAHLPDAIEFVESFCQRHGVGRTDRLHLMLVVEELFTNTVAHGHQGGSDAAVGLELGCVSEALTLLFEDHAPPFDALAFSGELPSGPDAPPGGLGIHLVRQIAASARYAHEAGRNRTWITLRRVA